MNRKALTESEIRTRYITPALQQAGWHAGQIREDFGKTFFTIMDFRNVTRLFADPDFDGEPVQIYEPGPFDPTAPDDPGRGDMTY